MLRPPGAAKNFEELCTGCGRCVSACPTQAIVMEEFPVFIGPCVRCMDCTLACDTGALKKISIDEIKIAVAEIDKKKCNAWDPKAGACLVCWEWCPVGAVEITDTEALANPSKDPREFVSKPVVNPEICIGCGMCIHACPKKGSGVVKLRELKGRAYPTDSRPSPKSP